MKPFRGEALSWNLTEGVIELALHREPCNEIGSIALGELETFADNLGELEKKAHALVVYSELKPGFCAGADLKELYSRSQEMEQEEALRGVRNFLERIQPDRLGSADYNCRRPRGDIRGRVRTGAGL